MSARTTIALLCASLIALASAAPASAQDVWVTMYFAAWTHQVDGAGGGWVRTEDIDWDAFTQMNYFSLAAQGDGSVCCTDAGGNMKPARVSAIVAAAHAHGKPILISVGGWGNYDGFRGAIGACSRARFVSTLVDYMTTWGFDGIDVDLEPINAGDHADYIAFVRDLRAAMDAHTSPILGRPQLAAAVQWEPAIYASLQDVMDQINIMTYDNSGPWTQQSWHNTSLNGTGSLPSAVAQVAQFRSVGVAPERLGIGIDFYAYTWEGGQRADDASEGITAPQQHWVSAPRITDNVAFRDIADRYGLTGDGSSHAYYRWDPVGNAPYLSIDQPGASNDVFVSYDDSRSIHDKLAWVREQGLGGVIIWELGGGFRNGAPAGDRTALLDAVRSAMEEGAPPPPPVDAGTPARRDAGTRPVDAGSTVVVDAGTDPTPSSDAGRPPTDGSPGDDDARDTPSSCSASPGRGPRDAAFLAIIGLALVALRYRKRS